MTPALRGFAVAATAVALLTGCSGDNTVTPETIPVGTAADSPPPAVTPAGQVRAVDGDPQAVIVDGDVGPVVLIGSESLRLLDADAAITLPAPATALTADGAGRALLATRGGYLSVDLDARSAERVAVDGQADTEFTAIIRRGDGTLVLGSADGTVFTLDGASAVRRSAKRFARVDALAVQGDTAFVLDRGQTSVTEITPDGKVGQALRAGEGATTMAADAAGRVLVTDTRGEELLVFSADPLIMRQRYPVHASPYGVAGSAGLVWVSTTANNQVVGYDLSTGIPVEKVRYPTVRQPNLLAYDDDADTLYVVSTDGGGAQVITNAAERP
ncbi:hypothetical protein MBRU_01895 [Mycolicibacterium brumae DSM 44177]|nr:hypothetical protein MBRU_01895 [Mycolicibacterium brumae DSM 44177]